MSEEFNAEKKKYHDHLEGCRREPKNCAMMIDSATGGKNITQWVGICSNDPSMCGLQLGKMECTRHNDKIYREKCIKAINDEYLKSQSALK